MATQAAQNQHQQTLTSFDVHVETKRGSKGVIRFTRTENGWRDALIENRYDRELAPLVSNEYVHNEDPEDIMDWLRCDFHKSEMFSHQVA